MSLGAIGAIGGASGVGGLDQLAQLYAQQVIGAGSTDATGGASGASSMLAGLLGTTGGAASSAAAARGADFGRMVASGLTNLESLDRTADGKAVAAATGNLKDVSDYVIAATQAQTATELTTTVRNKALDAFTEIMRMPL